MKKYYISRENDFISYMTNFKIYLEKLVIPETVVNLDSNEIVAAQDRIIEEQNRKLEDLIR